MMRTDKDALLCDLAETYGIYDFKALPLSKVALFSVGLRDDSRIKLKLSNQKVSFDTLIRATIADKATLLLWSKTEDCKNNRNRPESIVAKLLGVSVRKSEAKVFKSSEDFMKAWKN